MANGLEKIDRDWLENLAGLTIIIVFVALVAAELSAMLFNVSPTVKSRFVDILFGFLSREIMLMTVGRGSNK